MKILLDFTKQELTGLMLNLGEQKYRAEQLFKALQNGKNYGDNINLPNSLLDKLKESEYVMQPIKIIKQQNSKDKNIKFLYQLHDGNLVEGMLMKYKFGNTLCVSTQVGCKMNCAFCASSLNGFVRNLSAGEILGQVTAVNALLGGNIADRQITNVVLMGSGEPLDNYANVKKFLQILTSKDCFNMSVRNISVSTCGIPHKIEELADLGFAVTLCISLHAPNDATRREIMPIAKRYSIAEVVDALKYYHTITNRRIIIEYTLIEGVNNNLKSAMELAELLKDLPCHVNLIKLNEVDGRDLKAPTTDSCNKFLQMLCRLGVSATIRRSLGDDIEGACGMLRNKEISGDKVVEKKVNRPTPKKVKVNDVSKISSSKSKNNNFKKDVKSSKKSNYKSSRVR